MCVSVVVSLWPADGGQRVRWHQLYGSLSSVSVPQGSCGYNVAHHCQCVNVYMTDCGVKRFGVLRLDTSAGHLPFFGRRFTTAACLSRLIDISDCFSAFLIFFRLGHDVFL
ncbi:hypothetical protein CHARACLAT_006785 [Characodon lateralis]|uniref:Secreted protein n=1 Tax=Characodon lateralis TaxID=208331 RepID=A0ABU7E7L4_9TELE|nr:hypothetical protein [Characodon lateralis]